VSRVPLDDVLQALKGKGKGKAGANKRTAGKTLTTTAKRVRLTAPCPDEAELDDDSTHERKYFLRSKKKKALPASPQRAPSDSDDWQWPEEFGNAVARKSGKFQFQNKPSTRVNGIRRRLRVCYQL
jgi:hypothetical protein